MKDAVAQIVEAAAEADWIADTLDGRRFEPWSECHERAKEKHRRRAKAALIAGLRKAAELKKERANGEPGNRFFESNRDSESLNILADELEGAKR